MSICFGVLGWGVHASRVMRNVFQEASGVILQAIGTQSLEKVDQLRSQHPSISIYSSYQEVLQDRNIEAIYIALPNHLHCQWTVAALEHGKHVLCEKPLAFNRESACRIRTAAERANKIVAEALMYRFHPQQFEVRKLLQENVIGQVRFVEARYHYFLDDPSNIRLRVKTDGGGLNDVGCYCIDLLHSLFGLPQTISGSWIAGSKSEFAGVDEIACFDLTFPGPVLAQFICGTKLPRGNSYRIVGTKGVIIVPDAFHVPRNKNVQVKVERFDQVDSVISIPAANQYLTGLESFCDLVKGTAQEPDRFSNWFENAIVLEAARKAAAMGERQRCLREPICDFLPGD